MTEARKRELEAEMNYKKALLDIENDEVKRYLDSINDYYTNWFKKDNETFSNRGMLYSYAQYFRTHVDNSRARMEEIEDLKVELGIKEDVYI